MVSRSGRCHTQRTPAGETMSPRILNSLVNADLAKRRLLEGERGTVSGDAGQRG